MRVRHLSRLTYADMSAFALAPEGAAGGRVAAPPDRRGRACPVPPPLMESNWCYSSRRRRPLDAGVEAVEVAFGVGGEDPLERPVKSRLTVEAQVGDVHIADIQQQP